jgi:hypothetical protein
MLKKLIKGERDENRNRGIERIRRTYREIIKRGEIK